MGDKMDREREQMRRDIKEMHDTFSNAFYN